jgi:acyl-CoA oxidase
MKGGKSFWEAWNDSVVEINHAAFAHVENVCLKLFFENLEKEGETMLDSFSKDLLRKVIQLFALSTMEGDSGFFLEEGYFAPRKASAIRAQVSQLCKEIRYVYIVSMKIYDRFLIFKSIARMLPFWWMRLMYRSTCCLRLRRVSGSKPTNSFRQS